MGMLFEASMLYSPAVHVALEGDRRVALIMSCFFAAIKVFTFFCPGLANSSIHKVTLWNSSWGYRRNHEPARDRLRSRASAAFADGVLKMS